MGPRPWSPDLIGGGYSPYATWARQSVDALWWLADVDDWAYSGDRRNLGEHDADTIDIAHVRWATGTAKTAIDLCAADLAVGHNIRSFWGDEPEQMAATVGPEHLGKERYRHRLTAKTASWLSVLLNDPDYVALKTVRDHFTHRMTVRAALIRAPAPEDPRDRTNFAVRIPGINQRPDARELVVFSRDVATRYVESYFAAVST
jgi:hypothetical protein